MRPPSRVLMYRADPMASLPPESKLSQRLVTSIVVLAVVFGLVVTVLVLTANGDDKASDGPGGVHLTAEEQHGRVLFSDTCAFCHTLAGANAVARIGPNL